MKTTIESNYMGTAKAVLFAVFMVAVYAIAGTSDYHAAQRQKQHYCNMVERGAWPDFKDVYKQSCGKKHE